MTAKAATNASKRALSVSCRDGIVFRFDGFCCCGGLPLLLAQAFARSLSTNESADSRLMSNRARYYGFRTFLRWASGETPPERELSYFVLERYQAFTVENYAQAGAASLTGFLWNACRRLQREGLIAHFLLPAPLDYREALEQGGGSRTLADVAPGRARRSSPRATNERLVTSLLAFCDDLARERERRLELCGRWREELQHGEFRPSMGWKPRLDRLQGCTREVLLETACKLALSKWNGELPTNGHSLIKGKKSDRPHLLLQWILAGGGRRFLKRNGERPIGFRELRSYFFPDRDYLAVQTVFFLAAGVNPMSVRRLRLNQLVRFPSGESEAAYLVYDKPRAGGEVRVGPFPLGQPGSATLPRLWERIVAATGRARSEAPPTLRETLLIAKIVRGKSPGKIERSPVPTFLFDHNLKPLLRNETRPEYRELRAVARRLTPKLIRTTAKNILHHRLGGDERLTALAGGHSSEATLSRTYLLNASTRAQYEETIAQYQATLQSWLLMPVEVLPDSEPEISRVLGVDGKVARALRSGELSAAQGLCVFYERAVVVSTPLNCLRMIQWHELLLEARARMLAENPDRWLRVYAPQVRWFADAIEDFPRAIREEARRLGALYNLPMPEVA